jgi:hypothetical protein
VQIEPLPPLNTLVAFECVARYLLTHFVVSGDMVVTLNGEEVFTKYWHERIAR